MFLSVEKSNEELHFFPSITDILVLPGLQLVLGILKCQPLDTKKVILRENASAKFTENVYNYEVIFIDKDIGKQSSCIFLLGSRPLVLVD